MVDPPSSPDDADGNPQSPAEAPLPDPPLQNNPVPSRHDSTRETDAITRRESVKEFYHKIFSLS